MRQPVTPVPDQPALPCPSWCRGNHAPAPGAVHVTIREFAPFWVSLSRSTTGDQIRVHAQKQGSDVASLAIYPELGDADDVAEVLARLGHEDIAAAIRELAALAKGEADA
jgi:hypothetical protein